MPESRQSPLNWPPATPEPISYARKVHALSSLKRPVVCGQTGLMGVAMNHRFGAALLAIAAVVFSTTNSSAQSINCSDALIVNTTVENSDIAHRISILRMTKQSSFDMARRQFGAGATIPIGGINVTPQMDYAAFDQKRTEFLEHYRFNLNVRETEAFAQTYLSDNARAAYSDCLKSLPVIGARAWVLNASPDDPVVAIRITFITSQPDPTSRRIELSPVNGTVETSEAVRKAMSGFTGSPTFDIAFRRTSLDTTAILTVNTIPATGGSASILLPRKPKVSRKDLQVAPNLVSRTERRSFDDVEKQHAERLCIPHRPEDIAWLGTDGELVAGAATGIATTIGEAHGDQSISGPTVIEKQRICYDTNVGTDRSATGHSAQFVISAPARRPAWVEVND